MSNFSEDPGEAETRSGLEVHGSRQPPRKTGTMKFTQSFQRKVRMKNSPLVVQLEAKGVSGSSKCPDAMSIVELFLGDVNEDKRRFLQNHAATCQKCRIAFNSLKAALAHLKSN
jgi:hypothetical protein